MHYNTVDESGGWSEEGFVIELGSLYSYFEQLEDRRHARGKRYSLAQICLLATLAKLSGEDRPYGMAEWVQLREAVLAPLFGLTKGMPCHNTYRRVLGDGMEPAAFQRQIAAFLEGEAEGERHVLVAVDGKTLRGTIPRGQSQGVHLLAAYIPEEGIVLAQVAVGEKENEITAAPQLLAEIDLRDKVVIGDAMQTQRKLSSQIVESGGDYLWLVKENQPQMRADIATWFEPETHVKGFSPVRKDFQRARMVNKAHGRYEERSLTTSSMLNEYLDWPHVAQVFALQRRTLELATGLIQQETVYGITSLDVQRASPQRLNSLVRQYWGIENGLHYRRDRSMHEDATRFSNPHLAENMASLNNLIIGLIKRQRWNNLPQARRHYEARLHEAIQLVCRKPRPTL